MALLEGGGEGEREGEGEGEMGGGESEEDVPLGSVSILCFSLSVVHREEQLIRNNEWFVCKDAPSCVGLVRLRNHHLYRILRLVVLHSGHVRPVCYSGLCPGYHRHSLSIQHQPCRICSPRGRTPST